MFHLLFFLYDSVFSSVELFKQGLVLLVHAEEDEGTVIGEEEGHQIVEGTIVEDDAVGGVHCKGGRMSVIHVIQVDEHGGGGAVVLVIVFDEGLEVDGVNVNLGGEITGVDIVLELMTTGSVGRADINAVEDICLKEVAYLGSKLRRGE